MTHAGRETATLYAAVAAGSALGGAARWLLGEAVHALAGTSFPWATLTANVTGSFLIGLYAALAGPDGRLLAGPRQRQFVMAGLCGGYTTFSVFSLETLSLAAAGRPGLAGLYVGLSVVLWLIAVWAGWAIATRLNRLRR